MAFAISPVSPTPSASPIRPAGETSNGGGFQGIFASAVQQVEGMHQQASQTVENFLKGDGEDLHTVALATQQADLAFEMFQAMRNKVVSAYEEIMKMQM